MPREFPVDPLQPARDTIPESGGGAETRTADPVLAIVSALASQAEKTGRLQERLAAAERRAELAEATAREAERRCRAEADVADGFVTLLEDRLRAAEREAARLAVERSALGAEFARLWAARGDRTGPGDGLTGRGAGR
jgi:hypothetical protein